MTEAFVPARGMRQIAEVGTLASASTVSGLRSALNANFGNGAWPLANWVFYLPFVLYGHTPFTHANMWIGTPSGNIDIGLYSEDGTRLASTGSVAAAGTTRQVIALTAAIVAPPGRYYAAATADNTTLQVSRTFSTTALENLLTTGILNETTGGFGLPATATFAKPTQAFAPRIGLTGRGFA